MIDLASVKEIYLFTESTYIRLDCFHFKRRNDYLLFLFNNM